MAENDLQPRIGIEQARSDQAQRVDGGLLSERPGRAEQPGMAGIDPGSLQAADCADADRRERRAARPFPRTANIAAGRSRPAPVIGDLRKAVDQRAAKSERLDAALEFGDRKFRILHRKRREGLEARRTPGDLLGKIVVGASGDFVGLGRLGDGLHGGRIQATGSSFRCRACPSRASRRSWMSRSRLFSSGQ